MLILNEPFNDKIVAKKSINECIKELASLLRCDIIKLIELHENNYFATIKKEYQKKDIKYNTNYKNKRIYLKNSKNYILKVVLQNKQMAAYFKDDNDDNSENKYLPLIHEIENEIYIPLFLSNTDSIIVIGCIYLASFENKKFERFEDIIDDKVRELIIKINELFQIIHAESLWSERKFGIIHVISEMMKIKDPFAINHSFRVAQWSRLIGKNMSLDKNTLYKLDFASIMHDIGKIYIDETILNKKSRLSEEEFQIIKEHPINSYIMVKDIFCFEDELRDVCEIVKYHHERFDGEGYPDGLKGEDIPLESRILSVADSVDAMMSPRSYKGPKTLEETVSELISEKGRQFDPIIADIMVNILLKTKVEQHDMFSDLIIWGTLTINTKENSYFVEGSLEKRKIGYVFNSHQFNFSEDIKIEDVTSVKLYIEKNNSVAEFDVKIEGVDKNYLYIRELVTSPQDETFSMLWDLDGLLYDENITYEINIYKISGNSLSFYVSDTKLERHMSNKLFILTIKFDEITEITVTGKIVKSFSVLNKDYYIFKYINTPANIKDKIFRKLFRKQIELMQLNRMNVI